MERFRWTYGPMVRIFSHQHALSMRSTTCKQKFPGGLSVLTFSFDLMTQEVIGSRDPSDVFRSLSHGHAEAALPWPRRGFGRECDGSEYVQLKHCAE